MLQALNTPLVDHVITTSKTLKSGKTKTTMTRYQVTAAHVITLAVIYGLFNLRDVFGFSTGALGEGLGAAGEGAAAWAGTVKRFGLGFHMQWRGMSHNERNKFREEIGKAETWMPPGYPTFWK